MSDIPDNGPDFSGSGPVEYRPAETAQGPTGETFARHEARLLAMPGVTSVGHATGPDGSVALTIGVTDAAVAKDLPEQIEGLAVVVVVTGQIDAQDPR